MELYRRRRRKATSLNWEYLWTFNLPSTPRMILYTYMTVYDIVYIYILQQNTWSVNHPFLITQGLVAMFVNGQLFHMWGPGLSIYGDSVPIKKWELTMKSWRLTHQTCGFTSKMVLKNHGKVWILLHETVGIYLDLAMVNPWIWLI